jgi:hypothetical protein
VVQFVGSGTVFQQFPHISECNFQRLLCKLERLLQKSSFLKHEIDDFGRMVNAILCNDDLYFQLQVKSIIPDFIVPSTLL